MPATTWCLKLKIPVPAFPQNRVKRFLLRAFPPSTEIVAGGSIWRKKLCRSYRVRLLWLTATWAVAFSVFSFPSAAAVKTMELSVLIVEDDPKIAEIHRHFTEKVDYFSV